MILEERAAERQAAGFVYLKAMLDSYRDVASATSLTVDKGYEDLAMSLLCIYSSFHETLKRAGAACLSDKESKAVFERTIKLKSEVEAKDGFNMLEVRLGKDSDGRSKRERPETT